MKAGGRYRTVAVRMDSRAAVPRAARDLSRGIIAWILVLSAVLVLAWSPQVLEASGDAFDRAATAASELFRTNQQVAPIGAATENAAPVGPAAKEPPPAAGGSTARSQPTAAVAPRPGGAASTNPVVQPTNVPANPIVQPTATQPAPAAQPVTPAPQAAPIVAPQPAPTVAPQPTTAPTLAPTAAPTVRPTTAPTAAPVTIPATAVSAPIAPRTYSVPPSALTVATSAQLLSALARTTPTDIALADGVYDNSVPFQNNYGHRMYAARLGGAVFKAGLVLGGNSGPGKGLVQGLAFDVSDRNKTALNGIIHVWGTGSGTRILDSTFRGNSVIGAAIFARQPEGLVVSRVSARNFTSYGVLVDSYPNTPVLTVPVLLEDIDVSGVSGTIARSSNGTAEACIWMGNSGTLRRAKVRDCAWMGIWTGTANRDSLVENLDIDRTPVGIWLEHYTTRVTFQRINVGAFTSRAMNCEWADPATGGKPACVDIVIQDSTFRSAHVGVQLNPGTTRTTVRRVKFIGQTIAAIVDAKGINNAFGDNDYTQIASTAVEVSYEILNFDVVACPGCAG